MVETTEREALDCEDRLFEEKFLLLAQIGIQRLLNTKQLRYRDLAKRLGVSEARVSQMLGDEAANLTIRTIARIYRKLGEVPMIMSQQDYERALAGRELFTGVVDPTWTMVSTDVKSFAVTRAQVVEAGDTPLERRPAKSREWIEAEPAMAARGR